jgi:5-bromo-4-chloroindolyl phosphate hydrolysis protein
VLLAGVWILAYAMFDLTDMKSLVFVAVMSAAAAVAAFFMSPKSAKLADTPRSPETAQARKAAEGPAEDGRDDRLDGAIASLVELGKVYRQISGTKIGPQVFQMTQTTQEILEQVKADPEKMRGLRQFFGYFLPTSIDLLKKYASFSARRVKTDNITNSIRRIEDSIDNIAAVFRKEFDNLFMDDAVDISAEITVMEGMLASDGDFGGTPGRSQI